MLKFLACLPWVAVASNTFGAEFLEANKGKGGVITLPSGLQYKVLHAGPGLDHPTVASPCACHYEGRIAENYPSGQKFDSSYDRGHPATFSPNQVIKGWTSAMQLMVEGDKWELYIPSDLAYGDSGRPPKIPGGAVLIFTLELLQIKGGRTPARAAEHLPSPAGASPAVGVPPLRITFDVANLVGEPSEASFTLKMHPEWAPLGVKRLQELVEASFFDGVRFFRVIDNFMVQFGIHGDPATNLQWSSNNIKDDARVQGVSNTRGMVSFATAGPNTRTTQLFINFGDNSNLDGMGFTPIAEVVEGMDVVDRIYKVGEGAPDGPGPGQGAIKARGNAYLNERFPRLSFVKACRQAEGAKSGSAGAASKPSGPVVRDFGAGLKLLVTQAGDGETFPKPRDEVTMHYTLTLAGDASGKVIDSSRDRGQPFVFTIGRGEVIQGWDRGVMQMSLGERGVLTVPSALGYGPRGAGADIPPNAALSFDVEVLGINNHYSAAGMSASAGVGPLTGLMLFAGACLMLFLVFRMACGRGEKCTKNDIEFARVGKPAVD